MPGIGKIGLCVRALFAAALGVSSVPAAALSFVPWEDTRMSYRAFEHGGITRTVGVIAPARPQRGAPAVFVLPYNLGNAPAMANLTEVGMLARDHGVWVIVPEAHDQTWSHLPNELNATDDAGYLAALIDDSVARYELDARRIYMTGYSQGGNMAVRMACDYPQKIAAIAPVAATMRDGLARSCAPAVPTPVAFFHGTADKQVPYGPGLPALIRDLTFVGSMPAQDAAKYWAEINACTGDAVRSQLPAPIDDGTSVHVDRYESCPANRSVVLYTIVEGGHAWPGVMDFVPVLGITSQNIHATREMWEFFKRFSR